MSTSKSPWPITDAPGKDLVIERFAPEETFKTKAYAALKQAIINMDIYSSSEPRWVDERQLSEKLGVSRTPVREAIAMLEQEGFVRSVPRKGIMVLRKTQREVVEMVQAWAALESMAARLVTQIASDQDIGGLRHIFAGFNEGHRPEDHVSEYSSANIMFHQAVIRLSGSSVLSSLTDNLLLHVRGIRQITIGRGDRTKNSIRDHLAIIDALERRDTDAAEQLSRQHTLGLATYVEAHSQGIFD